jgi:hypothetical protein
MELCDRHMITSQMLGIGRYHKLRNKLSLLFNFALTLISLSAISQIVLRHLQICVAKNYLVMLFTLMQHHNDRMISAPVLLITKVGHEAEFVVAIDASKVGIVGVLLQEDTSGSLKLFAYWARKLKDCETRYSAYGREALAVVEVVYRVWKVYLFGCKYFSVVIDHATITHVLKQTSDKLTDRQVNWVERLMPFAHCMIILHRKGSINEADFVSRRPDFFHRDTDVHMRMPVEMFAL